MPLDGITVKCLVSELDRTLKGAKINRVSQPEKYDIYIDLFNNRTAYRLLLSANPSFPRAYLTSEKKENPASAPSFCMLLRKHLRSAHILGISSVSYERIINIDISAETELGDPSKKRLIIEIMGKYSNIILTDENNRIIDAIRHVDSALSSVREIMPARIYSMPPSQNKVPIELIRPETFFLEAKGSTQTIKNYIMSRLMGSSFRTVKELVGADIDPLTKAEDLDSTALTELILNLGRLRSMLTSRLYSPCLIYPNREKLAPEDFYCTALVEDGLRKFNKSISYVMDTFYREKSTKEHILSRATELLKTVKNNISRLNKKEAIHADIIASSEQAEKYRLWGELLISSMYRLKDLKNQKRILLTDFNSPDGDEIDIPLDPALSVQKNAEAYFKKYSRLVTAKKHSIKELEKIRQEQRYLGSIHFHIENASDSDDLEDIRTELLSQGYIKKNSGKKKRSSAKNPIKPYHYLSSEGFNIYVGKNNIQNDYLTLKAASSFDMWIHVKDYPGSHVILRYEGRPFTDKAVREACILAAYHSRAKMSENVDVDHTYVKNVKRHLNKKPGMVYYTNHMTKNVTPDEAFVRSLVRKG
jgi:predicted ribosome quality control (RQC) complex YloA/Tae2 family protein